MMVVVPPHAAARVPVKKIITAAGESGINIKVGMNIDAAGHHVATFGINSVARLVRRYLGGQAADQTVFNEQILFSPAVGIDDDAIFNQYAHKHSRLPSRSEGGVAVNDYSVASQLSGMAAYIAAQVTRWDFQVFSLGAWASGSLPGPKPMTGMP